MRWLSTQPRKLRPAQKLFLELVHTPTTDPQIQAAKVQDETLRSLAAKDWMELDQLILRSGLPGYFLAVITEVEKKNSLRMPPALMRNLRNARMAAIASYLLLRRVYDEVADLFGKNGIRFVPLKGIRLVDVLYPDPGWRQIGDIDILIQKSDLDAAHSLLLSRGFVPEEDASRERMEHYHYHHGYTKAVGVERLHLELHWNLMYGNRADQFGQAVWDRLVPGDPATLDPRDELLHLMLHFAKHATGIKWLVDIHLLSGRLGPSWRELEEEARSAGAQTLFIYARASMEKFLSVEFEDKPTLNSRHACITCLARPDLVLVDRPVMTNKWPYYAFTVATQDDLGGMLSMAYSNLGFKMHLWLGGRGAL